MFGYCEAYLREQLNRIFSWKNVTFMIGLGFLLIGAQANIAPDWDIGISVLMAVMTYLTATRTVSVLALRQWRKFPRALFDTWFTIDGIYIIYWYFVDRSALLLMRDIQWPVSLCLYLICGLIWLLDDSEALCDSPISTRDLSE